MRVYVCVCVCVCVHVCVCVETTTELLFTILLSVCVLSVYYVCVCVCVCVTNTHPITHIYHYSRQITLWCSVQYTDSQVGSDGDLGEGKEEEGGGAGLGMGVVSAPDPHVTPSRKRVWYLTSECLVVLSQHVRKTGNPIRSLDLKLSCDIKVVPHGTRMRGPADRI